MEQNKYFTPEIEDLGIGYECEIESNKIWTKHTLKSGVYEDEFCQMIQTNENETYYYQDNVRVPYLTKEDIEKEGWHLNDPVNNIFRKKQLALIYKYSSKEIQIADTDSSYGWQVKFSGKCKDPNTFRQIIKLLGI